jgi:hypothetical protein
MHIVLEEVKDCCDYFHTKLAWENEEAANGLTPA